MNNDTNLQTQIILSHETLRGEVALLRRAIEGLSAERETIPDYGPTLTEIIAGIGEVASWARKINDKPAMALTPESMEQEIIRAARNARAEDHEIVAQAARRMDSVTAKVAGYIDSAKTASEQERIVSITGCLAFLTGMLLILGLIAVDRPPVERDTARPSVDAVQPSAAKQKPNKREHPPGTHNKRRNDH